MTRKYTGTAILIGALFLCAFAGIAEDNVTETADIDAITPQPPEVTLEKKFPLPPGSFDAGKAMISIFGSFIPDIQCVRWKPDDDAISAMGIASDVQTVETHLILSHSFTLEGVPRHLLVFSTELPGEGDPARPLTIGISEWKKDAGQWVCDTTARFISKMESCIGTPLCEVVQLGHNRFGTVLRARSLSQSNSFSSLLVVGKVEGSYCEVLALENVDESNDGIENDKDKIYRYSSKLEFNIEEVSGGFYEISLLTIGSKPGSDGKPLEFNESRRFVYRDGKYQELK